MLTAADSQVPVGVAQRAEHPLPALLPPGDPHALSGRGSFCGTSLPILNPRGAVIMTVLDPFGGCRGTVSRWSFGLLILLVLGKPDVVVQGNEHS